MNSFHVLNIPSSRYAT